MYFAQDTINRSAFTQEVVNAIKPLLETADQHTCFALLDMSFDQEGTWNHSGQSTWPVYVTGRWSRLAHVGPVLLELPLGNEEALTREIYRIVRRANGRPMLSFIATRMTATALIDHWQGCIAVAVDGSDPMLLRFADARVLHVLPKALTADHWRRLSGPIDHWWVVARDGHLAELAMLEAKEADLEVPEALELDQLEYSALLRSGMPDAIVNTLSEKLPELLPQTDRAAFYEMLRCVVDVAEAHEIDSYPDTYALAVFAASQAPAILETAQLRTMLSKRDWHSGELARRLLELM